ncbi:hypothetical protein CLOSBL3_20309 [Clostridiaceae bacterium BL-3]|nr:hypothetical protein CLOSBL3_20309 [Clostridiaceae bacterium BL-3]
MLLIFTEAIFYSMKTILGGKINGFYVNKGTRICKTDGKRIYRK